MHSKIDLIAAHDALRASPASGHVAVAAVTGAQAPRSATAVTITGLHYSRGRPFFPGRASWVPSGLAISGPSTLNYSAMASQTG